MSESKPEVTTKKRRDAEFKQDAVRLITDQGYTFKTASMVSSCQTVAGNWDGAILEVTVDILQLPILVGVRHAKSNLTTSRCRLAKYPALNCDPLTMPQTMKGDSKKSLSERDTW